jgi:hypothetical protein
MTSNLFHSEMMILCSIETLFFPDISLIMVPSLFPKSRLIILPELQPAQPLGTLPEISRFQVITTWYMTYDSSSWGTVVGGKRRSMEVGCQEKVFRQYNFQGKIDCEAILSILENISRAGFNIYYPQIDQFTQ